MTYSQNMYLFGKQNRTSTMSKQRQTISMIMSFFSKYNAIVGKPIFSITTNGLIVQILYYNKTDIVDNPSIAALGNALTGYWGCSVELRLIRLNHAVLDSSIFAQYLSMNSKTYSFNRLFDLLKASLPVVVAKDSVGVSPHGTEMNLSQNENHLSYITGVKVALSGRLTTQRSIPRQTTSANRLGLAAKGNFKNNDYNSFTSKNKLGAFTMKVWTSQQVW